MKEVIIFDMQECGRSEINGEFLTEIGPISIIEEEGGEGGG